MVPTEGTSAQLLPLLWSTSSPGLPKTPASPFADSSLPKHRNSLPSLYYMSFEVFVGTFVQKLQTLALKGLLCFLRRAIERKVSVASWKQRISHVRVNHFFSYGGLEKTKIPLMPLSSRGQRESAAHSGKDPDYPPHDYRDGTGSFLVTPTPVWEWVL